MQARILHVKRHNFAFDHKLSIYDQRRVKRDLKPFMQIGQNLLLSLFRSPKEPYLEYAKKKDSDQTVGMDPSLMSLRIPKGTFSCDANHTYYLDSHLRIC